MCNIRMIYAVASQRQKCGPSECVCVYPFIIAVLREPFMCVILLYLVTMKGARVCRVYRLIRPLFRDSFYLFCDSISSVV